MRQLKIADTESGSPEERAEVEEARQNFYKNRYQIKPSGDLLWRMQVPLHLYSLPFISILFLQYVRSKLYKYYYSFLPLFYYYFCLISDGVADLKALQLRIYL